MNNNNELVINREVSRKLGKAIKFYRESKGLSLAALGEKANCSASYINRLENGIRLAPSIPVIKSIADALDVSFEHLIELSYDSGETIMMLSELILGNDYIISGQVATQKTKELLLSLLEAIVEFKWSSGEKIHEIYELLVLVDDLKHVI